MLWSSLEKPYYHNDVNSLCLSTVGFSLWDDNRLGHLLGDGTKKRPPCPSAIRSGSIQDNESNLLDTTLGLKPTLKDDRIDSSSQ
jgi:hypothetical protein